jgi:hypothetical protein
VYPKVSGNSRLPPCAGGLIPTTYAKEVKDASKDAKVKDDDSVVDDFVVDDTDEVKKERNEIQDHVI